MTTKTSIFWFSICFLIVGLPAARAHHCDGFNSECTNSQAGLCSVYEPQGGDRVVGTLENRTLGGNPLGHSCRCGIWFTTNARNVTLTFPVRLGGAQCDPDNSGDPIGTLISGLGQDGRPQGVVIDAVSVTDQNHCAIVLTQGLASGHEIHNLTLVVAKQELAICDNEGVSIYNNTTRSGIFSGVTIQAVDPEQDGVRTPDDNCPSVANPGQEDYDRDGIGDLCDKVNSLDGDNDGIDNSDDNCPRDPNPIVKGQTQQANQDGDFYGDACDPFPNDSLNDYDGDEVSGDVDNCPRDSNPDQTLDNDGDGIGDACDPDRCTGLALDDSDACTVDSCNLTTAAVTHTPVNANDGNSCTIDSCDPVNGPSHLPLPDADGDGFCDPIDSCNDPDGDHICDPFDQCPTTPAGAVVLSTGCPGTPEGGTETDGDGIIYGDLCPDVPSTQLDTDRDGLGDECDDDKDGDTLPDLTDNCDLVANLPQVDTDGNGIGDPCEASPFITDSDGDGIFNISDCAPFDATKFTLPACYGDADGDGLADTIERQKGSDPTKGDTDSDGVTDPLDCAPTDPAKNQDCATVLRVVNDDPDGDGVAGVGDNCPYAANADQKDTDGDGPGDACDGAVDRPPLDANPDESDNGAGDEAASEDEAGGCALTGNFTPGPNPLSLLSILPLLLIFLFPRGRFVKK